ncbi:Phosphate-selective porin O and P [Tenacibaculum sp. MAR_2009_124]|uniref:porin n=1 Tax=Tenacibaculum sp. MAR_2009_124 TaxID=1250059 RepID=UPI000896B1FE|nr:Phosphate-selective porin O and P [Tenacibaculum sp. MAR_2009_124]
MNNRNVLIVLSMLMTLFAYSQKKSEPTTTTTKKFGKGILNIVDKDSTWSMKFSARMQFLTQANWSTESGTETSTSFAVRRARLKFNGFAFSPKLTYKIELGLSNNDIGGANEFTNNAPRVIYDAVIKWNFHKNFDLWMGQTKLPGNRERVISSGDMQLVDRSLLNRHFNIDRDMGMQLRHHFNLTDKFLIREIIAISQGEGRNVTTGNLGGFQYTSRIEMLPFGLFTGSKGDYKGADLDREEKPKLALGFTYDFNNNAVKTRSNMGSYMRNDVGFHETNISTIFADAMFKYKGFSFMGEYAHRDAQNAIAKNSDGSIVFDDKGDKVSVLEGSALNLQGGYLFKKNWEVSGRYGNVSFEELTGKSDINNYTLGLSKYIAGHKLKVQTDISYIDEMFTGNKFLYRLQVDIHF